MQEALGSLLRQAGAMAQAQRSEARHELKADGSIVTDTDRRIEEFFRSELPRIHNCAFWGEEMGVTGDTSGDIWLIDPIDGTSNYHFGHPLWGITVGLRQGGDLALGGVILPDLNEVYLATLGQGAVLNGAPLPHLCDHGLQPHELVGYGSFETAVENHARYGGKMRHFGALVAETMFLASGRLRAVTTSKARLYDAAGSLVILKEVGCEIRYLDGRPFSAQELEIPGSLDPLLIAVPGVVQL